MGRTSNWLETSLLGRTSRTSLGWRLPGGSWFVGDFCNGYMICLCARLYHGWDVEPEFIATGILFLTLRCLRYTVMDKAQVYHLLSWMLACSVAFKTMASHDDLIFRHRGLGIIAVGWRAFLPKYCNSKVQCALAIAVISASELYWTVTSFHKDGEPFPMRVALVLQGVTLVHAGDFAQELSQLKKYQALKQELIEEKTAMASLISMICDSSMHLSLDGETIIRSGPQFDSMMELSAKGTSLKSYLPGGEGEENRLTDAFARARLGPVALPVTLLSKRQVPHKMDLFIVCRREIDSDEVHNVFGFLVGIRIEQNTSGVIPPCLNESILDKVPNPQGWSREASLNTSRREAASVSKDDESSLHAPSDVGNCGQATMEENAEQVLAQVQTPCIDISHAEDCQTDAFQSIKFCETDLPVRNTFLHYSKNSGSAMHRSNSAPAVIHSTGEADRHKRAVDQISCLSTDTDWTHMQWQPLVPANFREQGGTLIVDQSMTYRRSFIARQRSDDASSRKSESVMSQLSSEVSAYETCALLVKVGCSFQNDSTDVARLNDVLMMKKNGTLSIGSCHPLDGECPPCSFHFSHLRSPDKKPPCKASYMCEYCHDGSHHPAWRSKFRKCRPLHSGLTPLRPCCK